MRDLVPQVISLRGYYLFNNATKVRAEFNHDDLHNNAISGSPVNSFLMERV
jgi:hypothetical protein